MKHYLWAIIPLLLAGCSKDNGSCADINAGWEFWSDKNQTRQVVDLPHDAMLTEARAADAPSGAASAFYLGGMYHYEKVINADQALVDSHVTLQVEGVYMKSKVFVNDKEAGGCLYGYSGYDVCLDGLLNVGKNTIRIDADNSETPNTRWYSGAGVYRPLHLKVQNKEAWIDGVKIKTLSYDPAVVSIKTKHNGGEVSVRILDGAACKVEKTDGDDIEITIPEAKLWNDEHPNLYTAEVTLTKDGETLEVQNVEFGVRDLQWSPEKGLVVNGESVLLRGGCVHHDNGVLGAAEYDDAAMRRVAILKEYGFNAVRSAHNPISESMLRACDRLGMYIMDELWDMWYNTKSEHDYANYFMDNWKGDADRMIDKDYNHPSVVMYSIGNEVNEPIDEKGLTLEQDIIDYLHVIDPSRPTTDGFNLMLLMLAKHGLGFGDIMAAAAPKEDDEKKASSQDFNEKVNNLGFDFFNNVTNPAFDEVINPALEKLDIAGYNYANARFPMDAKKYPNRITVGSETFPGSIVENWEICEQVPNVVGDFMWTSWDYLGEAGAGAWVHCDETALGFMKPYPFIIGGAGVIDILGNPSAEAFITKALWQKDEKPYINVRPITPGKNVVTSQWRITDGIPCWSWPGCEGEMATVEVMTSAPCVRLYLNDELVGEVAADKYIATFELAYQPGVLRAVSVSADGTEHESTLATATGDLHIVLAAEKDSYKVGDLIYVNVEIAGENGAFVGNCDKMLNAAVTGGKLLGFGSASQQNEESFIAGKYPSYLGRAQAVIKADKSGTVKLSVSADGLATADLQINVK